MTKTWEEQRIEDFLGTLSKPLSASEAYTQKLNEAEQREQMKLSGRIIPEDYVPLHPRLLREFKNIATAKRMQTAAWQELLNTLPRVMLPFANHYDVLTLKIELDYDV